VARKVIVLRQELEKQPMLFVGAGVTVGHAFRPGTWLVRKSRLSRIGPQKSKPEGSGAWIWYQPPDAAVGFDQQVDSPAQQNPLVLDLRRLSRRFL